MRCFVFFAVFFAVFLGTLFAPSLIFGQSVAGDSISDILISNDTISENILQNPELNVKKPSRVIIPSKMIPLDINGTRQPDFLFPQNWQYDAQNRFRFTPLPYDPTKMTLDLNFEPPKRILELIQENPLRALIYGAAFLAGQSNNVLYGEDKMTTIRVDNMVQSHSGIPETARSSRGTINVNYEIDLKKHK
jgi:hypothetical protein